MSNYTENYLKHQLVTKYDVDGNMLMQDKWTSKINSNIKTGWSRIYMKSYQDVLLVLKSNLEIQLFLAIQKTISVDYKLIINQTHLAKKYKCSRAIVTSLIKRLLDIEFLKKSDGIYISNPFIFTPYNTPRSSTEKAQEDWNKPINANDKA